MAGKNVVSIGILSFQGDYARHDAMFRAIGARTVAVRSVANIACLDGLVIPGGESTTIGMLIERFGLLEPIRAAEIPVFGTCAGAILCARTIRESEQLTLGLIDVTIERNAYGRQVDSFEADIASHELGSPAVRGVFIRAPIIRATGSDVEVLAHYEDHPVLVRSSRCLCATFHPELTDDTRVHELFLSMVTQRCACYTNASIGASSSESTTQ